MNGRLTKFSVTMMDKPGQLTQMLQIIAEAGANIFNVNHDRMVRNIAVGKCVVDVTVETRNKNHCEELIEKLVSKGYDVK